MSSFLILSLYTLLLVLQDFTEGNTLLLLIAMLWEAKKSLKKLVFSVTSNTILLFTNRGGINGILVPL